MKLIFILVCFFSVNLANAETSILEALYDGNVDMAKELILRPDTNKGDINNGKALTIAVMENYTEIVKVLLEAGANPNQKIAWFDMSGFLWAAYSIHEIPGWRTINPLNWAIYDKRDLKIIEELLRHGAEVDMDTWKLASKYNAAKKLIEAGADVNAKGNYGNTPLAKHGQIEEVEKLLEAGADVNAADKQGKTAVKHALKTDKQGMTSVVHALKKEHLNKADKLIAAGADVNAADKQGKTPLMFAAIAGNLEMTDKLIAAGADVNAADKQGMTPLMFAAIAGNLEMTDKLIEAGANVNPKPVGYSLKTLLMEVLESGHSKVARRLIKEGAEYFYDHYELNIWDKKHGHEVDRTFLNSSNNDIALKLFSKYGLVEGIEELIKEGVDINKRIDGLTPLMYASSDGQFEAVEKLIAAGADVNAASFFYHITPVMYASENGHHEAVEKLIAAGADVNAADYKGNTAFQRAVINADTATTVKVLLKVGAGGVLLKAKAKAGAGAGAGGVLLKAKAEAGAGAGAGGVLLKAKAGAEAGAKDKCEGSFSNK